MPQLVRLSAGIVDGVDIQSVMPFMNHPDFQTYMIAPPGREHYRMLAAISQQLAPGTVISDVGTFHGASALALSINPGVQITTYDIVDCISKPAGVLTPRDRPNITFKIMSGQDDIETIAKSDVLMLDVSPHDGPTETAFFQLLVKHKFRGLLILDDIFLSQGMADFWNGIPDSYKKLNVSVLGHWSGCGCVVFDPSVIDVEFTPPYSVI